jgi:hypothetical protein
MRLAVCVLLLYLFSHHVGRGRASSGCRRCATPLLCFQKSSSLPQKLILDYLSLFPGKSRVAVDKAVRQCVLSA